MMRNSIAVDDSALGKGEVHSSILCGSTSIAHRDSGFAHIALLRARIFPIHDFKQRQLMTG